MRNIAVTGFPNLPGFERLNDNRPAIEGHEFDLVSFSLAMDMHDHAHIPCLEAGRWNVFGQYN